MKMKFTGILLGGVLFGSFLFSHRTPLPPVHFSPLPAAVGLGAYDPQHKLTNTPTLAYEEIWCPWDRSSVSRRIPAQLKAILERGRTPVLVVEPWSMPLIGTVKTLLPDIVAGKYDKQIDAVINTINSAHARVIVRWGQEMEFPDDKPWACQAPSDYIAAYRHFVAKLRENPTLAQMLWSPTGERPVKVMGYVTPDGRKVASHTTRSCTEYYPGDDVVDYVGVSIFEVPASSKIWTGTAMSFDNWLSYKYGTLSVFNKPFMVSEFGVDSSVGQTSVDKATWIRNAFASTSKYPRLKAIIYYNYKEKLSWAKWGASGCPDWSADSEIFQNPK